MMHLTLLSICKTTYNYNHNKTNTINCQRLRHKIKTKTACVMCLHWWLQMVREPAN